MNMTYSPTPEQLRGWWSQCEQHLESCDEAECSLYWAFHAFLKEHVMSPRPQTAQERYQGDINRVSLGDVLQDESGRRLCVITVYAESNQVSLVVLDTLAYSVRTRSLESIASWPVIESPRDAKGW